MKLKGIQLIDWHPLISSSLKSESIGVFCLIPSSIIILCYGSNVSSWLRIPNQLILFLWKVQNKFPNVLPIERAFAHEKSQGEVLRSCTCLQCPIQCHDRVQHRRGPLCPKNPTNFSQMAGFKEIQRRQNVTWEWSLIVVDKASI